jgi:hypothetical protein
MRLMKLARWTLIALVMFFGLVAQSFGQIGISVRIGPPALPVYDQPICPGDGYLWTPGYWAYADDDYYWVPGTWVEPPQVGFLWTPGYWGWGGSAFFFHEGYWGPTIGFYGGINYGFGYIGHGYEGGRWDGGHFYYNRSVTNINVTEIHNVYNTRVEVNNVTRVSYNGGTGGVEARASAQEEAAAHERHVAPVAAQTQHMEAARANPQLRSAANRGNPPIAATSKPGELSGHGVVPAKGAPTANEARPAAAAVHPKELPANTRPPAPNTGNPKTDQKYQQQQAKMYAKQDQERQQLQQKQDQQHQQLAKQKADDARTQQLEKQHQQQTEQLQQKHTQQQQTMQQHQQPQHTQEAKPENHKP